MKSPEIPGRFNQLTGLLGGSGATAFSGEAHPALLTAVAELLTNSQGAGLAGLVRTFEQQGLGSIVASWIGTGANQAISPEQLTQVLGAERIQAIASKLGIAPETVTSQLTTVLPQIINHVTPAGSVPHASAVQEALGALAWHYWALRGYGRSIRFSLIDGGSHKGRRS